MKRTVYAMFVVGSLVGVPAVAQTPPGAAAPAPQSPEVETIRGPRLGSPELVKLGPGVRAPMIRKDVKPTYPGEMMKAGVEGLVYMDCVVLEDGTVGDVRVSKSLHPALDKEAVSTVRKWLFSPATVDGKSVPVQVAVEMSFSLRKTGGLPPGARQ